LALAQALATRGLTLQRIGFFLELDHFAFAETLQAVLPRERLER
jgi:hypothetical protein